MCVGYIGGKTQTDIATMDDLYLDALGITDEDDLIELKGTKKKKGKKIDDPDFMVRPRLWYCNQLLTLYCSQLSSQSWKRKYPRLFKPSARLQAAKFCRNFLHESK